MRTTAYCLALIVAASLVNAQSLVDVSKKEKRRRQTQDKQGKIVKSFSNVDISEDEGDSSDPEDVTSKASTRPKESPPKPSNIGDWLEDKKTARKQWQNRYAGYMQHYNRTRQHIAELQRSKDACDRNAQPVASTEVVGNRQVQVSWGIGHVRCEAIPGEIASLRDQMRQIQVDCETDARRHFIPASKARLR